MRLALLVLPVVAASTAILPESAPSSPSVVHQGNDLCESGGPSAGDCPYDQQLVEVRYSKDGEGEALEYGTDREERTSVSFTSFTRKEAAIFQESRLAYILDESDTWRTLLGLEVEAAHEDMGPCHLRLAGDLVDPRAILSSSDCEKEVKGKEAGALYLEDEREVMYAELACLMELLGGGPVGTMPVTFPWDYEDDLAAVPDMAQRLVHISAPSCDFGHEASRVPTVSGNALGNDSVADFTFKGDIAFTLEEAVADGGLPPFFLLTNEELYDDALLFQREQPGGSAPEAAPIGKTSPSSRALGVRPSSSAAIALLSSPRTLPKRAIIKDSSGEGSSQQGGKRKRPSRGCREQPISYVENRIKTKARPRRKPSGGPSDARMVAERRDA